ELRLGVLEQHADLTHEIAERRRPRVAAADDHAAGLPVRVERVRDHAVKTEGERALPAPARSEQEEPLAITPFQVELAQRGCPPPDVSERERLDAGDAHQTSRTRSRPMGK